MTTVTPETRHELLVVLSATCETWFRDLARGFFEYPDSAKATELLIEATAAALVNMARGTPEALAVIETHIITLSEYLKEQRA